METKRFIGYVRVSTEEQANTALSLDAQKQQIIAQLDREGHKLAYIAQDAGYSGANANRPGLQDALGRLKRHEADGLIVAKLDRLSRSVIDFATIARAAEKQRWSVVIMDAGLDTTTPNGWAFVSILMVFAELERRLISQRTKVAMGQLRARGVKLGAPRQVAQPTVDQIRHLRNGGASWREVARLMNENEGMKPPGGGQWYPATCQKAYERHWVGKLDRERVIESSSTPEV